MTLNLGKFWELEKKSGELIDVLCGVTVAFSIFQIHYIIIFTTGKWSASHAKVSQKPNGFSPGINGSLHHSRNVRHGLLSFGLTAQNCQLAVRD
jgi:hypothetical protein